jgi:hypothetical protein
MAKIEVVLLPLAVSQPPYGIYLNATNQVKSTNIFHFNMQTPEILLFIYILFLISNAVFYTQ